MATSRPGRRSTVKLSCFVCGTTFRAKLMRPVAPTHGFDLREITHFLTLERKPDSEIPDPDDKICTNCHRNAIEHLNPNPNKLSFNCPLVPTRCCIICKWNALQQCLSKRVSPFLLKKIVRDGKHEMLHSAKRMKNKSY